MRRLLFGAATGIMLMAGGSAAWADPVTITFARFFGACEADYGTSTDVAKARGECGIITTLVNKFNAENKGQIVVKPQIMEWDSYYDQLTARIVSHDPPNVAVMHMSQIGDFAERKVLLPMEDMLKEAGIDAADMTDAAHNGVTVGDHIYALPWDTHSWLWHYNVGLMKQAGLVDAQGNPKIPASVDELLQQAAMFKQKTGKPMLEFTSGSDVAGPARTFYTLLAQQGVPLFPKDPKHAVFGPEAKKAFDAVKQLNAAGDIVPNADYNAATAGFLNGDAGLYINGTWLIDSFMESAAKPGSPLSSGYYVTAFPTLMGKPAVWADGHSWVTLKGGVTPANKPAVEKFLKFMWDNNYEWARTGHLPIRKSVIDSAQFQSLPFRKNIMVIASTAAILPHDVHRQFGLQTIIGEEFDNAISGSKTVDAAAASAQSRIDDLLAKSH